MTDYTTRRVGGREGREGKRGREGVRDPLLRYVVITTLRYYVL